jgi:hypothetical protein
MADPRHDRGSTIAHGYERMHTEKNHKSEDFERKTHQAALLHIKLPAADAGFAAGIIAAGSRLSMTLRPAYHA